MIPFTYKAVDEVFLDDVYEQIVDGNSVVFLGARHTGKRFAMRWVFQQLKLKQDGSPIWLEFRRERPPDSLAALKLHIANCVQRDGVSPVPETSDELFSPIDYLTNSAHPLILFASNVDGIPHHLARKFLEQVRVRVQKRELIVILSCEENFRDLVHGPNSEFNSATQYVFQGFAQNLFVQLLEVHLARLHVEKETAICLHLWRLTGGNLEVAKKLIGEHISIADSDTIIQPIPLRIEDFQLNDHLLAILYRSHVFSHTAQIVDHAPQAWDTLKQLGWGRQIVPLALGDAAPRPLELAGVAKRQGDRLQFASPIMECFVKHYYTDRHFGDLYARNGNWDEAFNHYAVLESERRLRPSGTDDEREVAETINVLCASLHSAAENGREGVEDLFVKGCRYILGLNDVSFFLLHDKIWILRRSEGNRIDETILKEFSAILAKKTDASYGLVSLREPWVRFIRLIIIPSLREEERQALLVGDLSKTMGLSRERSALTEKLLKQFSEAYNHAVEMERIHRKLEVRSGLSQIIDNIYAEMGGKLSEVRTVLELAAERLLDTRYKRVLFCLVDAKKEHICGIVDRSDNGVNVAEQTYYRLADPTKDLQPYVIHTRKPKIIPDASKEPLANQTVVCLAQMGSEAIIPILNSGEEAIGTIHIERRDGKVPSYGEVDDLVEFGRRLAFALEQSERVHYLHTALNDIPESVVIVDRQGYLRFVDQTAADLLRLTPGWRVQPQAESFPATQSLEIWEKIREALDGKEYHFSHMKGIGGDQSFVGAVTIAPISDWREETIGAYLHIRDVSLLYKVLEAYELVAEAHDVDSAMHAMMDASKLLGHQWSRLYLIDIENVDRLFSQLCRHSGDRGFEAEFNEGGIVFERGTDPLEYSWWSIDDRKPYLYRLDEEGRNGTSSRTEYGLEVTILNDVEQLQWLRKHPGDMWIDLPLIAFDRPIGKLVLHCTSALQPEQYEFLKFLSIMFARLLDAFWLREDAIYKQKRWIQEAAESAIGITAHNIATQFGSLPILLGSYRDIEQDVSQLVDLNQRFEEILDKMFSTIKRTRERLIDIHVRKSECNLNELVERALSSALPLQHWSVASDNESCIILADEDLLSDAILEMLQNSRDVQSTMEDLRVHVKFEFVKHQEGQWVHLCYTDNGPGVPNANKERIFEDFFTYHPGGKSGTGMGLAFVRRVVNGHGGSIVEQGIPGQGVKFVIKLPIDSSPS